MSPRVRITILIIASLIFLIVFSHSSELIHLSNTSSEHQGLSLPEPGNASPLFSLTVIPAKAYAHPGDPVDCEVLITPINGFNESVELELEVDAGPLFRGTYHAGIMSPPFPKTYQYRVNVPLQSPAPVTVHGTLRAKGGGYVDKADLVLFIEP